MVRSRYRAFLPTTHKKVVSRLAPFFHLRLQRDYKLPNVLRIPHPFGILINQILIASEVALSPNCAVLVAAEMAVSCYCFKTLTLEKFWQLLDPPSLVRSAARCLEQWCGYLLISGIWL